MKPVVKKDLATSTLIAFDDLMRDGSVFFPGMEKEFLKLVQSFKSLQRNFRGSEEERKRLKQERVALKRNLEQALQILNQENAPAVEAVEAVEAPAVSREDSEDFEEVAGPSRPRKRAKNPKAKVQARSRPGRVQMLYSSSDEDDEGIPTLMDIEYFAFLLRDR